MLSREEVEYYSEVFNMFDKDGSGAIDLQELAEAMESTGISPSESELRTMISGVAGDKEEVSLDQFLRMVSIIKAQNIKETQMDMREAFDAMDVDKNGYISASDLFKVCDNVGERLPADMIYEMLQFGDDDLDGKVGFQDFCKIMAGGAS
jgi:calmodulin